MVGDLRASIETPRRSRFRHNPALDGIRGFSITVIIVGHYAAGLTTWAGSRMFGVSLNLDWFFIMSGYLITALLLEEWSGTRTISMRRFYLRRAFRLLPAMYAFLAVFLVFALFSPWVPVTSKQAIAEAGAAAIYMYPAILVIKGSNAFLFHLWSLSVEEWFYLLWPTSLFFFGLRPGTSRRLRIVIGVLITVCVGAFLLRCVGSLGPFSRLVYSLRPDSLAWGALLAIGVRKLEDIRTPTLDRVLGIIGPLGAIGAVWCMFANYPREPGVSDLAFHDVAFRSWNYRLGILFGVLLIMHLVLRPDGRLGRLLSYRPIAFLGLLSYAMYLWHQPIFLTLNGTHLFNGDPSVAGHTAHSAAARIGLGVVSFGLALGAALLSRRFVELPGLRQKKRFETVANPRPASIAD
jgi:peptidoglycan/LPS O-acetylase OafA/YrhL